MKKSRFSDSLILSILKQAEAGTPVPELCREHGISTATFYKWRSKYEPPRVLRRLQLLREWSFRKTLGRFSHWIAPAKLPRTCAEGYAGVIVDGHMDVLPAGAWRVLTSVARDAVTEAFEAPQLLDVQVQQLVRGLVFVAVFEPSGTPLTFASETFVA